MCETLQDRGDAHIARNTHAGLSFIWFSGQRDEGYEDTVPPQTGRLHGALSRGRGRGFQSPGVGSARPDGAGQPCPPRTRTATPTAPVCNCLKPDTTEGPGARGGWAGDGRSRSGDAGHVNEESAAVGAGQAGPADQHRAGEPAPELRSAGPRCRSSTQDATRRWKSSSRSCPRSGGAGPGTAVGGSPRRGRSGPAWGAAGLRRNKGSAGLARTGRPLGPAFPDTREGKRTRARRASVSCGPRRSRPVPLETLRRAAAWRSSSLGRNGETVVALPVLSDWLVRPQ